ncbi:Rv1535 family protein [[Mycobacterium] holstebronense]|uniref:Rv1535 family protein n=1 Tax=[Mycobacterium] holstebronense TaxID=3064288 RepID=A0ABN9MYA2_9MYCO|nr:Rv1535 family protein [Mycolicibacter sp. MU0102]CAJ1497247.1 Rv1535 family protein [Mycolicibacter sp. MU0102]
MVAIAYTDITAPAPRAISAPKTLDRRPAAPTSDPLVDMTSRLLSGPLHQMYALLWRVGVLTVSD